jgi:Lar family restriction alleviation protein
MQAMTPCPFCGNPDVEVGSDKDSSREFYFAFCNGCEAEGPTDYDRDKAIERWNQRLTYGDWESSQEEVQQPQ